MNEVQTDELRCPASHSYQGGVWGSSKCTLLQLLHQMTPILSVLRTQKPREFPQEAGSAAPHPHQRRKRKTKFSVFPDSRATYLALLNNMSLLGPIKQECRSQIKPEATEKTNPAGGLAQPGGELVKKKKKKAWLPLSLSHLPSSSSPKSIP